LLDILAKDGYPLIGARCLASVIGQIISTQFVLGNKVRMLTRHMYNCVISRASWGSPVLVSDEAKKDIRFWRQNVRSLNKAGRYLFEVTTCQFSVFCDASGTGYGGYLESSDAPEVGCFGKSPEVGESFKVLDITGNVALRTYAYKSRGPLPEVSKSAGIKHWCTGGFPLPEVS